MQSVKRHKVTFLGVVAQQKKENTKQSGNTGTTRRNKKLEQTKKNKGEKEREMEQAGNGRTKKEAEGTRRKERGRERKREGERKRERGKVQRRQRRWRRRGSHKGQ